MAEIREPVLDIFFSQILSGEKTFALQVGNWQCKSGDTIIFEEVNRDDVPTGRTLRKTAGSIAKTNEVDTFPRDEIRENGFKIISLLEMK